MDLPYFVAQAPSPSHSMNTNFRPSASLKLAVSAGALALAGVFAACSTQSAATSATTPAPAATPASTPAMAAIPGPASPVPAIETPLSTPAPTPAPAPAATPAVASVDFDKDVKPIFAEYCVRCHGGGTRVSGRVNLATKDGLARVAGNSERSTLYSVISSDGRNHMPPQGQDQPDAGDIAMIKKWIDAGANIPDSYAPPAPTGG